jgi:death-on-curing protein
MNEPTWITESAVREIHHRQLHEHGGLDGVRDPGMLSSALSRPKNFFAYANPKPDIAAVAAAYAYGIIRNHAFVDGNKRTAYVVCRTFLLINGFDIVATADEKHRAFISVAEGSMSDEALAAWIRERLTSPPQNG